MILIEQFFIKKTETVLGKIIETVKDELEFLDVSKLANPEENAIKIIENEFLKPFVITSGSFLYKFILIKVSEDFHYLFMVCHHIITDGWGTSLMFQRLVKNYNELSELGKVTSTYPFSYKDFISDDEKYQKSDDYDKTKSIG